MAQSVWMRFMVEPVEKVTGRFSALTTPVVRGERQLAQRVADGDDAVADVQRIRVAEHDGGEVGRVDLQDGNVVALVVADELRVIALVPS